jgi:hypothetical protein
MKRNVHLTQNQRPETPATAMAMKFENFYHDTHMIIFVLEQSGQ